MLSKALVAIALALTNGVPHNEHNQILALFEDEEHNPHARSQAMLLATEKMIHQTGHDDELELIDTDDEAASPVAKAEDDEAPTEAGEGEVQEDFFSRRRRRRRAYVAPRRRRYVPPKPSPPPPSPSPPPSPPPPYSPPPSAPPPPSSPPPTREAAHKYAKSSLGETAAGIKAKAEAALKACEACKKAEDAVVTAYDTVKTKHEAAEAAATASLAAEGAYGDAKVKWSASIDEFIKAFTPIKADASTLDSALQKSFDSIVADLQSVLKTDNHDESTTMAAALANIDAMASSALSVSTAITSDLKPKLKIVKTKEADTRAKKAAYNAKMTVYNAALADVTAAGKATKTAITARNKACDGSDLKYKEFEGKSYKVPVSEEKPAPAPSPSPPAGPIKDVKGSSLKSGSCFGQCPTNSMGGMSKSCVGKAFNHAGNKYTFKVPSAGTYKVAVKWGDSRYMDKTYLRWDAEPTKGSNLKSVEGTKMSGGCSASACGNGKGNGDKNRKMTYSASLSAGTHTLYIGSIKDGNYYTVPWCDITVIGA